MLLISMIYHSVANVSICHECLNHFFPGVNDQNIPCQLKITQHITEHAIIPGLNLKTQLIQRLIHDVFIQLFLCDINVIQNKKLSLTFFTILRNKAYSFIQGKYSTKIDFLSECKNAAI